MKRNKINKEEVKNFEKELKEKYKQCFKCGLLEVIDYKNLKCYCSYMINNKCILK